jgi:hypothetical protein
VKGKVQKDKQNKGEGQSTKRQTKQTFVLFVFLYFALHLCFVCLFVLCPSPLFCLSFCTLPFTFVLSVLFYFAFHLCFVSTKRQTKQM